MVVNLIYCIDIPQKSENLIETDRVVGWMLCSHNILHISIADNSKNYSLNYGLSRPDVGLHFKDFPDNDHGGFSVISSNELIILKDKLDLEVEVDDAGRSKKINITLNLNSSSIQEIEFDEDQSKNDAIYKEKEEKYLKTLKKHPWITVRMDITNKCNLRCIMCHYKEEEIFSKPTKNITADQLKHQLQEIAPYVSHIMLSCGFEPLMSKHFAEIVSMIHNNYPHMEIAICTNGMLMNSKARKVIIENNVTHVILSFDGVTRQTLEKIRVGADYGKIISNIKALHDLKIKHKKNLPKLFMDFVLMNSNIHEAPAFVQMCTALGIEIIDFRHLVGNIYFSVHEEMLSNNKEKYNYYRQLIIAESKKHNIQVRLPEPYDTTGTWATEGVPEVGLTDFNSVQPDPQTQEIAVVSEIIHNNGKDTDFAFLSNASCLRPFNEIMIIDQEKILPCSWYNDSMGVLDENNTLYSIFFGEKFQKIRRKKMLSRFDHNCLNCPIKLNLLPTEVVK